MAGQSVEKLEELQKDLLEAFEWAKSGQKNTDNNNEPRREYGNVMAHTAAAIAKLQTAIDNKVELASAGGLAIPSR